MALSTAQPMKLLSLCVGFHGYSVKDSTDSQLSFVLVAGLSGLHSHSDFFSPLRPQWSSHIFSSSGCFSLSQMEMSTAGPGMLSHQQRSMKRRRWGGLRQQWKLLGLFEIDQQHEFYSLTCMMKEGLAAAIQNTIDDPPAVSSCQETVQPLTHGGFTQSHLLCSEVEAVSKIS